MTGGMPEPNGIVGGHGIEIGGGDVASFSELAFIPAKAYDPIAGLDESDLGLTRATISGTEVASESFTP
jgi:hypothetical protein